MFNIKIDRVQLENLFDFELAWKSLPYLLEGIPVTLSVSIIGMLLGLLLGFILSLARSSTRILLRSPARIYISFMRGTPIIVFLFLFLLSLLVLGYSVTITVLNIWYLV